ncbi:hypothetical protein FSARC_2716 [Fusarium sarcochroum]|uniref:Uncharacterized protein n=1 Tax=Fusarium sarcochroum TaxID=1208366 RepID=A0A8H4U5Z9_9HYPO|nr:hypothetical protein FSARC_2716 [Fusarium sarcochroum]
MAVVKRGIPKQQYMRVDEKVLYWIGVRKPATDSPSNLGYQSLLLALSDQMLAVGLCYLIAMYAQSYFRKHPRQALLRGGLMMLFVGLLVATLVLEFITLSEPRDRLFLCGLHYPMVRRLGSMGTRCFAISILLAFVYWNAFRSIRLDPSLKYELDGDTSNNTALRWIFSRGSTKADFESYSEKKQEEKRRQRRKNAAILERRQFGFWKVFGIVMPLIIAELVGSVLFELLVAIFSFSIAMYTLVIGLFHQGVDTKSLFTASFGQIMPMLLLLVIALTAVEVGTIKNFRRIEIEVEMKKHPASLPNATRGFPTLDGYATTSSRVSSFGLQNSLTGIEEGKILKDPPNTHQNSVMSTLAASHSQPDLSGNAGVGTRVDSMTRWMTPRRTNTLELEEGQSVSFLIKHLLIARV